VRPGRARPAQEAASAPAAVGPAAPESLAQALEQLAKREFDLDRTLQSARLDLESSRRRFESAQQRLDAQADPDALLREEVAARRLQLESAQRIVSLLEGRIARASVEKQTWQRLHDLEERTVLPETLSGWISDNEQRVGDLDREAAVKGARLEEVRQDIGFTRERLAELSPESPRARWISLQERALQDLARHYEEDLASIASTRALQGELAEALMRAGEQLPLSARLRAALHHLRAAWNYELTGSEQEPITPGKIVSALLIFLIGWFLARQFARLIGDRLFPRLRLEEGAARAFQSLVFYFLMLVAFLTALRMVQIPLTAFAVVGGALAIGVGFGSQNVVNNFISGIILLVERPIKLNDLIEIEGIYGNVERIGLRSTRVRTGDNVHIIVRISIQKRVSKASELSPKSRKSTTGGGSRRTSSRSLTACSSSRSTSRVGEP
jgi:hypothetical protein